MFHCLYYFVNFNESKGQPKIGFCRFSVIMNIVVPLLSSKIPMKLICQGIVVFVCFNKSIPIGL